MQEELGVTLEKATEDVLGTAAKVTVGKEACVIVGSGQYEEEIKARVSQIKNMISQTEQDYEREKLNERVARLSGGVAVLQVGAQTETELKEKKLRVEDALNATKAAVEEGIVVGGGCTLVHLAGFTDAIKEEVRCAVFALSHAAQPAVARACEVYSCAVGAQVGWTFSETWRCDGGALCRCARETSSGLGRTSCARRCRIRSS